MINKNKIIIIFFSFLMVNLLFAQWIFAQNHDLLALWKLEKSDPGTVLEGISQIKDTISGNYKYVKGVEGEAIRFDGFTTVITRDAERAPLLHGSFTFEGWVAAAAYPWNWCPLLEQEKDEKAGYYFGIGPRGEIGLSLSINGEWISCISEERIPLREWTHLAATFNKDEGIKLFMNGKIVGKLKSKGEILLAKEMNLIIGMNREKKIPSHPVRPQATLPAWYSFDGIIDEIKIYGRALTESEISQTFQSALPLSSPDIPPRVMPSGPAGPGRFGAYYTQLKYYEEWDALWRVGSHADVVVQFDESPIRVIFWRGTRYSPVWVMENGIWMADQSAESFTKEDGCFEHMLDAQCRYSHVRIIENTEARVVVHWRYIPVSVRQQFSQQDERSGWPDCIDEYYSFYPDGVGVRKVIMWTSGRPLGPQETIILCQPGQRPEDVVNLDALTLVNLKGESYTYSWAKEIPDFSKGIRPENPIIQVVNLKSKFKPFMIFEPGCRMRVFAHEQRREVAPFPWWNHWPEAQIPSDGRYAQAPDRPSHFSLAWGGPPIHKGSGLMYWASWLYGATEKSPEALAGLARSWAQSPEMTIKGLDFINNGYDPSQRAYILRRQNQEKISPVEIELLASDDSPLVNCCLVIKGWREDSVEVELDGQKLKKGKDFRLGHIRTLDGDDLIVWISKESTQPVKIQIRALRTP